MSFDKKEDLIDYVINDNTLASKVEDVLFNFDLVPTIEKEYDLSFMLKQLNLHTKKIKIVYRIENDQGFGPYSEDSWRKINQTPANGRPTPNVDDGFVYAFHNFPKEYRLQKGWFDELQKQAIRNDLKILFGFSSFKQLWRWFHHAEENKILFQKLNFKIKTYRNVEGFDSGTQSLFFMPKK